MTQLPEAGLKWIYDINQVHRSSCYAITQPEEVRGIQITLA